jgi:hypothetical protein
VTVDDVAALLKVSRSWVYEHTRSRGTDRAARLPHLRPGKYIRSERRAVVFGLKLERSSGGGWPKLAAARLRRDRV